MRHAMRMAAVAVCFLMTLLIGCSNDSVSSSPSSNVMDEMLVFDLQGFTDDVDGEPLGDWGRVGGEGLSVSTTVDGMDVRYYLTKEPSYADPNHLNRLQGMTTISVTQVPGKVLKITISEAYSAATKTIGRQTISYSVTENPNNLTGADLAALPSMRIDREEAHELMDENGGLQHVEQIETSPIDFFVTEYIAHEGTAYTDEDWGSYERITSDADDAA